MQAQPYRKGPREPGLTLSAMLRGAPAGMPNPMDVQRRSQVMARGQETPIVPQPPGRDWWTPEGQEFTSEGMARAWSQPVGGEQRGLRELISGGTPPDPTYTNRPLPRPDEAPGQDSGLAALLGRRGLEAGHEQHMAEAARVPVEGAYAAQRAEADPFVTMVRDGQVYRVHEQPGQRRRVNRIRRASGPEEPTRPWYGVTG